VDGVQNVVDGVAQAAEAVASTAAAAIASRLFFMAFSFGSSAPMSATHGLAARVPPV
jgi:hypothetical protein